METQEMGEIALALMKLETKRKNTPTKKEIEEHIKSASICTGVPYQKIKDLYKNLFDSIHQDLLLDLDEINEDNHFEKKARIGYLKKSDH